MSKRKNPSESNNPNADLTDLLMELAENEKNVERNVHKYNAYRKAAGALAAHPTRVQSGAHARQLSGIGDKIAKKIDEFLQTGKLRKLDNIHENEESQAITLLTRVSGIGPVKAAQLVRSGVLTLEQLRENEATLTHHQFIGLKYFEDFEKKIPRSEIFEIEVLLKKMIKDVDAEFTVTICGSYRRGKAESGDIDVLVTHPSLETSADRKKNLQGERMLKSIIDSLKSLVTDVISIGDTKFMGVCQLSPGLPHRRLDVRLTPAAHYHCAVLYFTGSDVFNKTMRAHAQERRFTLNEYSLRPVGVTGVPGEVVPITSEEEIFDYIDFPYRAPEQRNL